MNNHLRFKHKETTQEDDKRQSRITSFTSTVKRRCEPARAEEITQLIAKMLTEDMLPLSLVEGNGYLTVTWELKFAVLQTRSSDERHTAVNIAEHVKAVTAEWCK